MIYWQSTRFQIPLDHAKIMGIINATPDSFSDGGVYSGSLNNILRHAEQLVKDGAHILDIGGESTRPNARAVSPEEEWQRVAPVLREISQWQIPISLDTRRTVIMRQALESGWVDIINDVQALEDKGAIELLAQHPNTGICLMHMQGLPENMQRQPHYQNVVEEVAHYLQTRVEACLAHNIAKTRIVLDPGFGFGKTLAHNIALMQNLHALHSDHELPLLIGVSRKRMIGDILQRAQPSDRTSGSIAAALFAIHNGAKIIRTHDVKETTDAIRIWETLSAH